MTSNKLRVVVTMDHAPERLELLAPGGKPSWGRCEFEINPPVDTHADYWIVYGNARPSDRMRCAPINTFFVAGEPLEKKLYPDGFYRQFYRIVDSHDQSRHPRLEVGSLGMCWHVGIGGNPRGFRFGYDYLKALQRPEKENRISVVCSNLTSTEGQRRRLQFLAELKVRFGDRIVHYGRGFQPIDDKMDAILPHRFHLVLENCESPNYWTEKLADAYLGWAFPLYVGCPNLEKYFSRDAFVRLNPRAIDEASAVIQRLLDSPETEGERQQVAVARDAMLNNYNPFACFAHWAETHHQNAPAEPVVIRSQKAFRSWGRGLIYRWKMRNR